MKRIFRSLAQWRRVYSPIGFFILSLLLIAPLLAACAPSIGDGLAVGDAAPAFTLPTASGDQVALSDYRGSKPVLLYFHMADG
jgi:hypothetical protein